MQERLIKGTPYFVHETFGAYKTLEELWDGDLWADTEFMKHCGFSCPVWSQITLFSILLTW
jgi:hypothetical protein